MEKEPIDAQSIQQEIEEHGGPARYFNNLICHFYSDLNQDKSRMGNYRSLAQMLGYWQTPYREIYQRSPDQAETSSEVLLNQTPEEFYTTFDTIIEELQLKEEIQPLVDESILASRAETSVTLAHMEDSQDEAAQQDIMNANREAVIAQAQLYEKAAPLYIRMREMGYTHLDLTQ